MHQEIGPQYGRDKFTDPTGFLEKARLHQSRYRAFTLSVPFDKYGNYLTKIDALKGLNFYHDLGVFDEVEKRFLNYNTKLYANMLRSEHIGFNLFGPLKNNPEFGKKVLNLLLSNEIQSIEEIIFEHAPHPASRYLNDKTSFDVYIEYVHTDTNRGIIGIEVKYTERAYRLKTGSKEALDINDLESRYHIISTQCGLYHPESINLLKTDDFRQVWRNQLLGESIVIEDKEKFKHFTSMTIFPKANSHFAKISQEYSGMLLNNHNRFVQVSYEDFLAICYKCQPSEKLKNWLQYLEERYVVNLL